MISRVIRFGYVGKRERLHLARAVHFRVAGLFSVPLISITDDDDAVRTALSSLVRSYGYAVKTFTSAEEFLQSEAKGATSCLITDVQMPGMSGIDLQAALLEEGRSIPIIFITAFSAPHLQQKAIEAGASAFLSKPFQANTLIAAIERALHV